MPLRKAAIGGTSPVPRSKDEISLSGFKTQGEQSKGKRIISFYSCSDPSKKV
jgi:hypothetical protein